MNSIKPAIAHYISGNSYASIEDPGSHSGSEIDAAERWIKEQGVRRIYAPLGASTWLPYRATVAQEDPEVFFYGESNFSPHHWEERGYTIAARYISSFAENQPQIDSARSRKIELESKGWTMVDYASDDGSFLQRSHHIANRAFANAFCFQPVSWPDFQKLYQPLLQRIDPRLVLLARSPTGEIAGFSLSYPDLSNPSLKRFVLKTLAVDPQFANRGIGSWLVGETHARAEQMGFVGGIHALMWQGSHSQAISKHAGRIIREYVLFCKES